MALSQKIKNVEDGRETLSILLNSGEVRAITDEHPGYADVLAAVEANASDEKIVGLLDPANLIYAKVSRLTERYSLAGGTLLFDGDPVEGPLADFIVQIAQTSNNKDSFQAYVNFAEKVAQNPSQESREHLFAFITTHGLTITKDGDVVLYKGVRDDGTSVHAGPGIVNGEHMNGHLPNEVGSVLEFPRSKVNAERHVACATGLHAGTHAYASSFASRLLTVLVNPRDVVSVPSDHSNAKVRVCRYTVLELNERSAAYSEAVLGAEDDEDNDWIDDDGEDYDPTDLSDEDVEDATAPVTQVAPAPAAPSSDFEAKVQAALVRIPVVIKSGWDKSLALYASKHVTAANRDAFREAIRRTGLR